MSFSLQKLSGKLQSYGKLAIAFSGGCDSAFLAGAAKRFLGPEQLLLLLADSVLLPRCEAERAREFAEEFELHLEIVKLDPLASGAVRVNDPLRCYHCKKLIFSALSARAGALGFARLADGANADDLADYRPGAQAAAELGVLHPLQELGMTKQEIRELSHEWGLPSWNLPAAACLASRVPTGIALDAESLGRIEAGEAALSSLGFSGFRVRKLTGDAVRLEFRPDELAEAELRRSEIAASLLQLGFLSFTFAEYRTGSMNQFRGGQS